MLRFLTCLVVCLVPLAAPAEEHTTYRTDTEYGVRYAEERIVKLPEDQGKWYVTILGNPSDPQFTALKGWFDSHPTLKNLKGQTHYNALSSDTVMYRDRYAPSTRQLPCVRVQDAQGRVISEYSGTQVPMSPDALARGIIGDIRANWPCPGPGPCPRPYPQPQPQPEPDPMPDPEPSPLDDGGPPDIGPMPGPEPYPAPDTQPGNDMPPAWLLVLLFVGGFAAGAVTWWKETYFAKR